MKKAIEAVNEKRIDLQDASDSKKNIGLIESLDAYSEKFGMNIAFMHYAALCGIFPPSYNIVKHWKEHQDVFLDLVKREGNVGIDHFMQALM